jgi:DNA (cytosine-5)-methyltransferase 1
VKFVFDWHSQDSRATGPLEVANTVTAQYGTGGGNTPIVVQEMFVPRKRQYERGGDRKHGNDTESLQCADSCGGG